VKLMILLFYKNIGFCLMISLKLTTLMIDLLEYHLQLCLTLLVEAFWWVDHHGGVGVLFSKRLMSLFKCMSVTERLIVVSVGGLLIFNVYPPTCIESGTYVDSMLLLLAEICNVINLNRGLKVVICGDFNFDFDGHHRGCILFKDLMSSILMCAILCSRPSVHIRTEILH